MDCRLTVKTHISFNDDLQMTSSLLTVAQSGWSMRHVPQNARVRIRCFRKPVWHSNASTHEVTYSAVNSALWHLGAATRRHFYHSLPLDMLIICSSIAVPCHFLGLRLQHSPFISKQSFKYEALLCTGRRWRQIHLG